MVHAERWVVEQNSLHTISGNRPNMLSENLKSTLNQPSTELSAEAESEDILIDESDRAIGILPARGEVDRAVDDFRA